MQRRSVDLPQPEGPMMAVTFCAGKCRLTSCTPARAPYHAVKLTTRTSPPGPFSAREPAAAGRWSMVMLIGFAFASISRADTLMTSTSMTRMNEPAHACSCWYSNGPVAYVKMRSGSASIGRKTSVL